ncbi:MAG: hypothetical protein E5V28_03495 [Mesorhizobium sp.]|nr:MAG: hypothetical protein E5V28_03495 [Mesorhizobium sp.]
MGCILSRPPLSCRTSPPRVGRSAVVATFANLQGGIGEPSAKLPISLLVGEMSGRTEGARRNSAFTSCIDQGCGLRPLA